MECRLGLALHAPLPMYLRAGIQDALEQVMPVGAQDNHDRRVVGVEYTRERQAGHGSPQGNG